MIYNFLFTEGVSAQTAVVMFIIALFVFVFSLSLHEFAHAFAAYKMGDPSAKNMGRMSLNPARHLDLIGFLFFLFIGVGWAKPVPVNPNNFRNYKKGSRIVSISGVLANFILGVICAIAIAILNIFKIDNAFMDYLMKTLAMFVQINGLLVMFNILPIPSLDGFNFLATFVKGDNKFLRYMLKNGFRILLIIILVGIATDLIFGFDIFTIYLNSLSDFEFYIINLIGA